MPDYRSRQERRQSQAKKQNKGNGNKDLWKKILLALCVFVGLCIVGGGIAVFAIVKSAPPLNPKLLSSPISSVIYDKDGKKVTEVFGKHNRLKVDIQNVPPLMKKAVISIEDRRFYQHIGIDPRRIIGAALSDIAKGKLAEGASTIDQQVVKRVFLSPKKSFVRKIQGAWLAIQLDRHYSKDQIMQMYLNQIYYGHGAYGIKKAAETYFGVSDLSKLNLSQMALLAGLPNLPSADDPYNHPKNAKERRAEVLHAMVANDVITKEQAQKAESKSIKSLLAKQKKNDDGSDTPYYGAFIDVVYNELVNQKKVITKDQFLHGGLKIYTTYDSKAQQKVYEMQHTDELNYPDKYFNSGIALIDTQSGAIRAIGGGRNYTTFQSGINFATVKTDIGSTAKPIADYGPVIQYKQWPTSHILKDTPYKWPGTNDPLHDWDNKYKGKMTMRDALAYSRNIPAAKTFFAVGKDKATQFAESLGIQVDKPVPSTFSIGSFKPGASPLQMAGAYAAFGDQGVYHKPYAVKKVVFPNGKTIELHNKPKVVMHDYTSYMVTDMLKSVIDYGTASRLGSILPSSLPVAGKTGSVGLNTEKYHVSFDRPLSDEWFVGYTPQYTMAVWTGYSTKVHDGKVYYVKGGQPSERIAMYTFGKVISAISSDHVSDWKMPDSVVKVKVEKDTGMLASDNTPSSDVIEALFVKGTQPTKVSTKYQKPDAPTNLEGTYDDKKHSITLKWDYPKDKKDIKFDISYSVDGGSMQALTTTDKTQITLKNAAPGSTYTFQVVATNGDNSSDPAQTTVKAPGAQLQPPVGLNAKYDKKNNMIIINWSGSGPAYEITYSADGGQPQSMGTSSQTQAVINNPNPGSTYTISVATVQGNQKSDPATVSVQVPKSTGPGDGNGGTDGSGNTGGSGGTDGSGTTDGSGGTDGTGTTGGSGTTDGSGSTDGTTGTTSGGTSTTDGSGSTGG